MAAFHAKYKGQCTQCGRWHIAPGDLIIPHPEGGYAKPSCMMQAGVESRRDINQAKKRTAKQIRDLTMNTAAVQPQTPRIFSPSEKIAKEVAMLAKMPREPLHPGGIEDFR